MPATPVRLSPVLFALALGAAPAADDPNALTDQEARDGVTLLFDGATLDGWTTSGSPDAWGVENGEIVTRPTEGAWWLRTTRQYRDFELWLDFKIPEGGNSGVGLRSSAFGDPAFTGMEIQILDTHGQEPGLTNCGALYDAIPPDAMAVKPPGEWNTYHIKLVGDTLDATLNGVVIHEGEKLDGRGFIHTEEHPSPVRDRLTTGYIALQEHGHPVAFRNIKIRDLSPDRDPGGFQAIYNGKDTGGWHATGEAGWTVEDGAIVGRNGPGHLFSDAEYADFEIRAHVRVNRGGNGGLYIRARADETDPNTWPHGYECQVDQHDGKNFTGCVYDRAWPQDGSGVLARDEAWFDYRVLAVGNQVCTWINGQPVVQAELFDFADGKVALQSHHAGNEIMWRDLEVRQVPR